MRVLIVEDETALREQLAVRLKQEGHVVDAAADGKEGLYCATEYPLDIAIIDLGLPQLSGIEVIRHLRAASKTFPILILTARGSWQDKVQGLEAGADDYLVKPFSLNELQARVRALLRRGQQGGVSPVILYGGLGFDTVGRMATLHGRTLPLSTHETGVLEALLHRFGRVVSKERLVEQLYSYDKEVSQNAIEVYVHRLRKKIAGSGVTVRTLYGQGYLLDYMSH